MPIIDLANIKAIIEADDKLYICDYCEKEL